MPNSYMKAQLFCLKVRVPAYISLLSRCGMDAVMKTRRCPCLKPAAFSPFIFPARGMRVAAKIVLSTFLLTWAIGLPQHVSANTPETDLLESAMPLSETMEQTESPEFEYVLDGRPDPFVPFITEKAATPKFDPNEIIDEDVELTGMRQFEPSQLRLVAILETARKKIAMVEDVTGRGYTINEGTPIGRRGVVTQITRQQVIITETAHTRAGKEIKNTIVMRLNKEGE